MRVVWSISVGLFLANAALAQSIPKIGYVDVQRALTECDAGKKAIEEFQGFRDKLGASLKKQKEELDSLKSQLEKKSLVMKDEEVRNLEDDFRKKLRDYDRNAKDSDADLQKKQQELSGGIIKDLEEVIHDYGEREGYTVILERTASTLLYGSKSADLTDTIMQQYNTLHPAKKKGK